MKSPKVLFSFVSVFNTYLKYAAIFGLLGGDLWCSQTVASGGGKWRTSLDAGGIAEITKPPVLVGPAGSTMYQSLPLRYMAGHSALARACRAPERSEWCAVHAGATGYFLAARDPNGT